MAKRRPKSESHPAKTQATTPKPQPRQAQTRSQPVQRQARSNQKPATPKEYPSGSAAIPCSPEAEEALLGSIMTNPFRLPDVRFVSTNDFFLLRHQYVYQAIQDVADIDGLESIDYLSVSNRLSELGYLDEVGGIPYLMRLINNTPTSVHPEVYGHIVHRSSIRRKLLSYSEDLKNLALDETLRIERVMDESFTRLTMITHDTDRDWETNAEQAASAYFDALDKDLMQGKPMGLPTGLKPFDKLFLGLHKSELAMIVGESGGGKTTLMYNWLRYSLIEGKRVVLVQLEGGVEYVIEKLLAMETGIPSDRIKNRDLNQDEIGKLVNGIGTISKWDLKIVDRVPEFSPLKFRRLMQRMMTSGDVDLVGIDGLWRMYDEVPLPKGGYQMVNGPLAMGQICKKLADEAVNMKLRLVINHQYKKDRLTDVPNETDVLGAAHHDPYLILGIYRPEDSLVTELRVMKHRGNVRTGTVIPVLFDERFERYTGVDKQPF